MSNSNSRSRRLPLIIILLLLGIGTGYLLFHRFPVPPTTITLLSANLPQNEMSWSDRYIPGSWVWFWRLKSYVNPARNVLIEANFIELNNASDNFLNNLLKSGTELANTNGIRALGFTPDELNNLRQRLSNPFTSEKAYAQILSSPRIQTADSIEGTLMTSVTGVNQNSLTIKLGAFPRLRDGVTDLTSTLLVTETLPTQTRTNLAIWTRSRITNACGLLLLECQPTSGTENRRMAVLISATSIRSKK